MRIAFYAPLKPPDHPVASGDRTVARGLIAALRLGGHDVALASRFKSSDAGDPARQARLRDVGGRLAERYVRRAESGFVRPDLWFTYHLYHKAPDWLGPAVSRRLGIPYVLAEASYAPKQAGGRWDIGHRAVAAAIRRAAAVFQPNPADRECVLPLLASADRLVALPPFLDTTVFSGDRGRQRADLADRYGLDPGRPWLVTAAMMRADQKLRSYRVLAEALGAVGDLPWSLIVAGGGPAEAEVRAMFAPFGTRICWAGIVEPERLRKTFVAADLFVWPAVKEAWGMALLEAQAAGLAVVAGRSGGVASVVTEGETALLAAEGDAAGFAAAVRTLLVNPRQLQRMGHAAFARARREHDIAVAAATLDRRLRSLVELTPAGSAVA